MIFLLEYVYGVRSGILALCKDIFLHVKLVVDRRLLLKKFFCVTEPLLFFQHDSLGYNAHIGWSGEEV